MSIMDLTLYSNSKELLEAEAELQEINKDLSIDTVNYSGGKALSVKVSFPTKGTRKQIEALQAKGWVCVKGTMCFGRRETRMMKSFK